MTGDFLRQLSQTRGFSIGEPHHFRPTDDGTKVAFLRAASGTEDIGELWIYDVRSGIERQLVDPRPLIRDGGEDSSLERARRERVRAFGGGIVDFVSAAGGDRLFFTLARIAWMYELSSGTLRNLPTRDDPQGVTPNPDGTLIAYAAEGGLHLCSCDGGPDRTLRAAEGGDIYWGLAEFVAAEELDRFDGIWWSPSGDQLLASRVDESRVVSLSIADPSNPESLSTSIRYPRAGTPNADVSLWILDLSGSSVRVRWDHDTYEYLARVTWDRHQSAVVQVLSRDQKAAQVLKIEDSGRTRLLRQMHDQYWIEIYSAPKLTIDGELLLVEDVADRCRVTVDGKPIEQGELQVSELVYYGADGCIVTAYQSPTSVGAFRLADSAPTRLISGHIGSILSVGGLLVVASSALDSVARKFEILDHLGIRLGEIRSLADDPGLVPNVEILRGDESGCAIAVVRPRHTETGQRLPIVMHPYGGPHRQRVVESAKRYLEDQWLADQGFCVVIADGRGMLGHNAEWERAIAGALAEVTLADQVDALNTVARTVSSADASRVGILGWSFGGFLAAVAVMDLPDVFHVGVVGAAVSDWHLYNTCYTERYLGDPSFYPEVYETNSLVVRAAKRTRPLLLIHGLVDDNVVAANSLALSSALLVSGSPHAFLPLSGVAHLTPQPEIAVGVWEAQVRFIRDGFAERERELHRG